MTIFLQNHHHRITQPAFGGIPIPVLSLPKESIILPPQLSAPVVSWFLIIPFWSKTATFISRKTNCYYVRSVSDKPNVDSKTPVLFHSRIFQRQLSRTNLRPSYTLSTVFGLFLRFELNHNIPIENDSQMKVSLYFYL